MNPLVVEALGSIVRWALTFGGAYLVKVGIWSQADATTYVAGAAMALIALGWSIYQKYGARLKLVTALASPVQISEAQVEHKIAIGATPSVTTPKDVTPQL